MPYVQPSLSVLEVAVTSVPVLAALFSHTQPLLIFSSVSKPQGGSFLATAWRREMPC